MRARLSAGIILLFVAAGRLQADEVAMQNGDRYFGKVLAVSADTVVLQSEVLGKISVPRKSVAALAFGTNAAVVNAPARPAAVAAPTNFPVAAIRLVNTNMNLSAVMRHPGLGTNVIGQIRAQMLAGSPEATAKYDEMVNGLMNGSLNMNDLRREAQADADQLRALKRDLGPDAAESLDGYLQVLDAFLKSPEFAGVTNEIDGP
jgi:hypothetical protein